MAGLDIHRALEQVQRCRPTLRLFVPFVFILLMNESLLRAQTLAIQTGTGINISGLHPNYSGSIGNVNGLGVGAPASGVSLITSGVGAAVFYYTSLQLQNNWAQQRRDGKSEGLGQYELQSFRYLEVVHVHLGLYIIQQLRLDAHDLRLGTTLVTGAANNTTSTAYLGVLVSNINGGSAFSGLDSVSVSLRLRDTNSGNTDTVDLAVSLTVQTAVSLTLGTSGGLTVSPGSDYSMNFVNVNGLGINPAPGLTTAAATGGYLYRTPYLMTPQFSSFTTTSGTLKVYVGTNFLHPAILQLQDSSTLGGTYTAISTNSGGQTSISTSATTGTNVTRYLGLWVSNANGASAFTGADNATLTYSLTVP